MTSQVGALELPVPAGTLNTEIDDPTVSGIAAYLRFCLRDGLNTKLANVQGTSSDAVPGANVFKWDPGTYFVRGKGDGTAQPFPALYVWWGGKSQIETDKLTMLTEVRRRDIHFMWVFDELLLPNALGVRHGLLAAADAIAARAFERRRHPGFAFAGYRAGADAFLALNLMGWQYQGSQVGFMGAIPHSAANPGGPGEGASQRAYPAITGIVAVWEQILSDQPYDFIEEIPSEVGGVAGDLVLNIKSNGVDILEGVLPGPDGSEEL